MHYSSCNDVWHIGNVRVIYLPCMTFAEQCHRCAGSALSLSIYVSTRHLLMIALYLIICRHGSRYIGPSLPFPRGGHGWYVSLLLSTGFFLLRLRHRVCQVNWSTVAVGTGAYRRDAGSRWIFFVDLTSIIKST
jgi:hypothetical protein